MQKRFKERGYSIKVINRFPNINETLTAMLNGCVIKDSASTQLDKVMGLPDNKENESAIIKILESSKSAKELLLNIKSLPDDRNKKIVTTLANSLGNGHNAAGDIPHYIVSFEQIPRIETLRQARQPRGFNLLQQSTRRVEHDSVYKPKCIAENEPADFLFDLMMSRVLDNYFEILDSAKDKEERAGLRQDAMFILPLYLQTNNAICGSARGFWQYCTEGMQKDMPEVTREISGNTLKALKEENPLLFWTWKINYKYEEFYPSSSDFLAQRNVPLEEEVRKHNIPRGSKLLSQDSPFEGWSVEDVHRGVTDEDPAVYANLIQRKAKFLAKTDISIYHELFRQRTLDQTIGSFISAMDDRDKTFFVPDSLKQRGFEDKVKYMYRTLEALYNDLQLCGISKQDAVGVAPHGLEVYSMLTIDGWNLIHLSGSRLCSTAKPSMRQWMRSMVDELKAANNPMFGYLVPKGQQYGFCPDNHPKGCNVCKVRKE